MKTQNLALLALSLISSFAWSAPLTAPKKLELLCRHSDPKPQDWNDLDGIYENVRTTLILNFEKNVFYHVDDGEKMGNRNIVTLNNGLRFSEIFFTQDHQTPNTPQGFSYGGVMIIKGPKTLETVKENEEIELRDIELSGSSEASTPNQIEIYGPLNPNLTGWFCVAKSVVR